MIWRGKGTRMSKSRKKGISRKSRNNRQIMKLSANMYPYFLQVYTRGVRACTIDHMLVRFH